MLKKLILVLIPIVILVVGLFIFVIPIQAHTQTIPTNIGTAYLDVYINYTNGQYSQVSSQALLTRSYSLTNNGAQVSSITIVVSDSLNSSVINQAISTSAKEYNQPIQLTQTNTLPAKYVIPASSLTAGTLEISSAISAITSQNIVYSANLPTLSVSLTESGSTTNTTTTNTSTNTPAPTLSYPYGLPQELTTNDGISWKLLTCTQAEAVYNVVTCSNLQATYAPLTSVTYVSWSQTTGLILNIGGQQCAQMSSTGITSSCFAGLSINLYSKDIAGSPVYGISGRYPKGFYPTGS